MSEYLPGAEEKLAKKFQPAQIDSSGAAPGGAISDGYEAYVRSIFRPDRVDNDTNVGSGGIVSGAGNNSSNFLPRTGINFEALRTLRPSSTYANSSTPVADALNFDGFGTVGEGQPRKVSAITMLRMENQFGKEALDESMDNVILKTPLESVYEELGIQSTSRKGFSQYPVYTPKMSREYFMQREYARPTTSTLTASAQTNSGASYREKADEEWRKSNRQLLIDYKNFDSSPLSPYMYRDHPYVQRQDTRIIGSNFVQLTTRPRDRFLDKIDETLAQVRAMPRY